MKACTRGPPVAGSVNARSSTSVSALRVMETCMEMVDTQSFHRNTLFATAPQRMRVGEAVVVLLSLLLAAEAFSRTPPMSMRAAHPFACDCSFGRKTQCSCELAPVRARCISALGRAPALRGRAPRSPSAVSQQQWLHAQRQLQQIARFASSSQGAPEVCPYH
jgi:hypothetical protein